MNNDQKIPSAQVWYDDYGDRLEVDVQNNAYTGHLSKYHQEKLLFCYTINNGQIEGPYKRYYNTIEHVTIRPGEWNINDLMS